MAALYDIQLRYARRQVVSVDLASKHEVEEHKAKVELEDASSQRVARASNAVMTAQHQCLVVPYTPRRGLRSALKGKRERAKVTRITQRGSPSDDQAPSPCTSSQALRLACLCNCLPRRRNPKG